MTTDKSIGLYTFKEAVRAPYLNVIKARPFRDALGKEKGEPKFSATVLIKPGSPDLGGIKEKMVAVALAAWPGRDLATLHWPIQSGDQRADKTKAAKGKDLPFMRGHFVMDSRSKFPVVLNVLENGQVVELSTDVLKAQYGAKFYGGCWIAPTVNFVAYPGQGGADGVTAYFQSLLWIKDDERIGGVDQQSLYKEYVGSVTAGYDPTGGVDAAASTKGLPF